MSVPKPKPWERLEGEGERAFTAFQAYLRQPIDGEGRSIRRLHADGFGAHKVIGTWSSKFRWRERARAWDDYLAEEAAVAAAKEHARNAAKWERRRLTDAERTYAVSGKLRDVAEKMLKYPIKKKRVTSEYADGKPKVVIYEPAKWSMASAATIAKLSDELAARARESALHDDEWDSFDPTTASLEECQAFITTQKQRRAAFLACRYRNDIEDSELDRIVREARKEAAQSAASPPAATQGDDAEDAPGEDEGPTGEDEGEE